MKHAVLFPILKAQHFIALFKNVVGLKTFGVFLPILIAFTLVPTGYFVGMFLFLMMLVIVAILSRFLNTFQLLYTPKVVVILTFVITIMLITVSVGLAYNIDFLMALTLFPIIIVSIASERFARAIEEDGFQDAAIKLLQTLQSSSSEQTTRWKQTLENVNFRTNPTRLWEGIEGLNKKYAK